MITMNGKKFAGSEQEYIDSLFVPGGTCVGYYRLNKKTIVLQDTAKKKIGVITVNNCLLHAHQLDNGKWWYCFADIKLIGEYGSYSQKDYDIQKALELLS